MRNKNIIFTLLAMIITNSALIADPSSSNWAWAHRLGTSVKPLLGNILRKTAEYGAESYHCVLENPVKSAVVALLSTTGLWGAYRWGHKSGKEQGYWNGVGASKQLNSKQWDADSVAKLKQEPIDRLRDISNQLGARYNPENDLALKYPYSVENTGHNTVQLGRISGQMYNNLSENIDNLNATDDNLSLKEKTDALKERMRENMRTLSNYHLSEGINLGFALAAYSGEYTAQNFLSIEKHDLSIEKFEHITTPIDLDTAKKNRINSYIHNQLDNHRRTFQHTCTNPEATVQEIQEIIERQNQRVYDIQLTERLDDHRG